MSEEKITIHILDWLKSNGWEIVCFDFPQSGTGISLHPDDEHRQEGSKNKNSVIPDIVAHKNGIVAFFENKNRFYFDDFVKVKDLRENNNYTKSINKLLSSYSVEKIFYGVGLLDKAPVLKKALEYQDWVDFILTVSLNGNVTLMHDRHHLFQD